MWSLTSLYSPHCTQEENEWSSTSVTSCPLSPLGAPSCPSMSVPQVLPLAWAREGRVASLGLPSLLLQELVSPTQPSSGMCVRTGSGICPLLPTWCMTRWGNRCVVGGPYDTQHLGLPTSLLSVMMRENSVYNDHTVLCALGPGSEVGAKGLSSPWVTSLAGGCSLPTLWPYVNTEEDPGWGRESGSEAMLPILVPAPSAIASIGGYCQLCLSLLN